MISIYRLSLIHIYAHREEILKRWNQVNLYSMTRGINRFRGLAAALEEADRLYTKIEDVQTFVKWTEDSDELSNAALEQAIGETDSICMKKALNWSQEVNKAITELPKEDIKPFGHVQDVIRKLHETCDIAIVSSANYEAVREEWTRFKLLTHVDVLLAQNAGSKKSCIEDVYKRQTIDFFISLKPCKITNHIAFICIFP